MGEEEHPTSSLSKGRLLEEPFWQADGRRQR